MESLSTLIADPVLYLYGIVPRPDGLPAIDGVEPGSPVFLVPSGDLACAVSVVSAREYQQPHDENASEYAEWITRRAWRHHEVLRELHSRGTVLPLKFGATAPAPSDVERLLSQLRERITDLLQTFGGKDEWTLRMLADKARVATELQDTTPQLLALRRRAAEQSDGRAYFVRKQLLAATADAVAGHLASLQDAVCDRLRAAGVTVLPLPTKSASREAHPPFAIAAVLVDRDRREALKAMLSDLEAAHAEHVLTFELVGPWAPYSFAGTLDLSAE